MGFWVRAISCTFFIRVMVRVFFVCICSASRVGVGVRVRLCWNVYIQLHVLKGEKWIRDRVFLSSYVYVCAFDSVCVCVRVCRCVYKCWRFCLGWFEGVPILFQSNSFWWKGFCKLIRRHSDMVWVKCVLSTSRFYIVDLYAVMLLDFYGEVEGVFNIVRHHFW